MSKSAIGGKVVWITGASSGIGRAIALEAASLGARIILSSRRADALDEVAKECQKRGAQAAAVLAFDLESADARAEACAAAPGLLGAIDVLILNAGMSQRATFLDTFPEVFDRIMNLDFSAQVDLIRRCLPAMVTRGTGCLVGISSIAGLAGAPLRPAYSAAKHALAGLLQNLRSELVGTGVRVVTAYPGYVRTGVARNALTGDGSPASADDPHIESGCEAAPVARRILRSVLGGNVEIKVAFDLKSRFGLFLSRYVPSAWATLSAAHAGLGTPR